VQKFGGADKQAEARGNFEATNSSVERRGKTQPAILLLNADHFAAKIRLVYPSINVFANAFTYSRIQRVGVNFNEANNGSLNLESDKNCPVANSYGEFSYGFA